MTKCKIIFLLALGFIVCENVFSQAIKINYDSLMKKPYEFTVNKTKFRFRVYDTSLNIVNALVLEKYNAAWITTDTLNYAEAIYLKDINNDGFIDISLLNGIESDVYLFNPAENIYVGGSVYSTREDYNDLVNNIELVNKKEQIYFDYFNTGIQSLWYSYLFQIKNYQRINLGIIRNGTRHFNEYGGYMTTRIIINKILDNDENNTKLIKEIKWDKDDDFHCSTYWKNNWQKFLPQKN